MKLSELVQTVEPLAVDGSLDREITGITYDSRRVLPGNLFVAVRGAREDASRGDDGRKVFETGRARCTVHDARCAQGEKRSAVNGLGVPRGPLGPAPLPPAAAALTRRIFIKI